MTNTGATVLGFSLPLVMKSNWFHAVIPLTAGYSSGLTPDTLLMQITPSGDRRHIVNHDTMHIDGLRFGYVTPPAPPAINAVATVTGSTTLCTGAGDSIRLMANTGTNYTYQWNRGGAAITGATTANYEAKDSGSYTVVIDSAGVTDTSNAIIIKDSSCVNGINNVAAANLSVYPNPASTLLNITCNQTLADFNFEAYDIVGRLVISQVLTGTIITINVANLANGTYIYRITDKENGVVTQNKFNVIK